MNSGEQQQESSPGWLQRYARLLDSSIPLPMGMRIGIDSVIGLVPGLGDALGAILSSVIVVQAFRLGVSWVVIGRMLLNLALELVVGAVPVLGDIFDMAFKANLRNVKILEQYQQNSGREKARGYFAVGVLAFILIALAIAAGALVIAVLQFLFSLPAARISITP